MNPLLTRIGSSYNWDKACQTQIAQLSSLPSNLRLVPSLNISKIRSATSSIERAQLNSDRSFNIVRQKIEIVKQSLETQSFLACHIIKPTDQTCPQMKELVSVKPIERKVIEATSGNMAEILKLKSKDHNSVPAPVKKIIPKVSLQTQSFIACHIIKPLDQISQQIQE